ncbi:hypothetical protein Taro_032263 [Colocasia esculenta]|uniref:Uncharacterized protein n=1 Tax=Colocasia esculenta TaxID=4460 RepID=A0A843VS92_COLES|nr:hypothetical protein [Colocasia esculenta]
MRLGPIYSSDPSSLVTSSNKSLQLSTSGYQSSGHADLELGVLARPVTALTGWQPRSSRFDREVTAPNPAGISVTPSEIDGSSSSHVRVLILYKG